MMLLCAGGCGSRFTLDAHAFPLFAPLFRLHISLTGVAGQMALDFVAFADGQSVVYSGPSAAPTTVPANCTQA